MTTELIACHDCDLLQRCVALPAGGVAHCVRCQATLYSEKRNGLDRTLALTIAGLVLFVVANLFPFLSFKMQGSVTETTLASGVFALHSQGMWAIAGLVLLTTILAPLVQLSLLLWVLLPIKLERRIALQTGAFRALRRVQPWSMMEIFLIGILVSLVKLADMAELVPGLALWAFALLIIVLAGAGASLEPRTVWRRLEAAR